MSSFISTLKDLIMVGPASPRPSPKLSPQLATPRVRRGACTHTRLTRLYGNHLCLHCGQFPSTGWVYRCVQDYDGQLPPHEANYPPLDRNNQLVAETKKTETQDDNKDKDSEEELLKPWVRKAIKEGHYTPEQVEKLKAQRRRVLECIKEDLRSYEQSTRSASSSTAPKLSPPPGLESLETVKSLRRVSQLISPKARNPLSNEPPPSPPRCNFTICHTCRPLHRDRSWECVDHVYESSMPPMNLDTDNRPTISRDVAQNIGFSFIGSKSPAESHESIGDIDALNPTQPTDTDSDTSDDIRRRSLRLKKGQSKKMAVSLRSIFAEDVSQEQLPLRQRSPNYLVRRGESSDGSSKTAAAIKRDKEQAKSDNQYATSLCSGILNTGPSEKELSYDVQSSDAKQKGKATSVHGLADEVDELKVSGGVAVTEEGVDQRAADVIIPTMEYEEIDLGEDIISQS